MVSVAKAYTLIDVESRPLASGKVALADAVSRVLAEDVIADSDMPPFDRSQMDGYAVRAVDTELTPVELKIVGESAAGRGWRGKLRRGETVRIMTGAPLPAGADSVQKIELTSEADGFVTVKESTAIGRFIVQKGKEIKRGKVVLRSGETIDDKNISVLAAFGYSRVKVAKRPRVAIFSTGSEIVEIDRKPGRDQIRNSNSLMLKALCELHGASVTIFPTAGDDISDLKSQISDAIAASDILVTTGGVSVGKYDLTKRALAELGAEIFFERVRLKPGKPTVFARLKKTLVFSLPGNPVSAAVTYQLFVRRAILRLQLARSVDLRALNAAVSRSVKATSERDAYLPATLATKVDGRLVAKPLDWHGSSDFVGFAAAEALIVVPRARSLATGDVAKVLLI